MRCPKCRHTETKVNDSRPGKNGKSIRRRRECLNSECMHRFTTFEEILRDDLVVVKRDGRREEYDYKKIVTGVEKATSKRPIPLETIENLIQRVTRMVQDEYDTEVPSRVIGQKIAEGLKEIDQIAYVRFASVYKEFKDLSELAEEIRDLNTSMKCPQ